MNKDAWYHEDDMFLRIHFEIKAGYPDGPAVHIFPGFWNSETVQYIINDMESILDQIGDQLHMSTNATNSLYTISEQKFFFVRFRGKEIKVAIGSCYISSLGQ